MTSTTSSVKVSISVLAMMLSKAVNDNNLAQPFLLTRSNDLSLLVSTLVETVGCEATVTKTEAKTAFQLKSFDNPSKPLSMKTLEDLNLKETDVSEFKSLYVFFRHNPGNINLPENVIFFEDAVNLLAKEEKKKEKKKKLQGKFEEHKQSALKSPTFCVLVAVLGFIVLAFLTYHMFEGSYIGDRVGEFVDCVLVPVRDPNINAF